MRLSEIITLNPEGKIYLRIKVTPKQPKTECFGVLDDGTIKIRLKATPERGRANEELIRFLSEELNIPKSKIEIVMGVADPLKMVRIEK